MDMQQNNKQNIKKESKRQFIKIPSENNSFKDENTDLQNFEKDQDKEARRKRIFDNMRLFENVSDGEETQENFDVESLKSTPLFDQAVQEYQRKLDIFNKRIKQVKEKERIEQNKNLIRKPSMLKRGKSQSGGISLNQFSNNLFSSSVNLPQKPLFKMQQKTNLKKVQNVANEVQQPIYLGIKMGKKKIKEPTSQINEDQQDIKLALSDIIEEDIVLEVKSSSQFDPLKNQKEASLLSSQKDKIKYLGQQPFKSTYIKPKAIGSDTEQQQSQSEKIPILNDMDLKLKVYIESENYIKEKLKELSQMEQKMKEIKQQYEKQENLIRESKNQIIDLKKKQQNEKKKFEKTLQMSCSLGKPQEKSLQRSASLGEPIQKINSVLSQCRKRRK